MAFLVYMHRPSLFYLFLAFIWLNLLSCCLEPTPLRLKVDRSGPVLNCSGNESENPPGRLSPQTTSLHVLLLAPSRPPSPSYMHTCMCTCVCCYVAYLRTHMHVLLPPAGRRKHMRRVTSHSHKHAVCTFTAALPHPAYSIATETSRTALVFLHEQSHFFSLLQKSSLSVFLPPPLGTPYMRTINLFSFPGAF